MHGIHDITLLVNNVAELRGFYERIGFKLVIEKGDDMAIFAIGSNEFVLHTAADTPRAAVGISIRVDDTRVFESRLRELGIPFEGPKPLRPGLVGLHFKDPNGNVVELLQAGSSKAG